MQDLFNVEDKFKNLSNGDSSATKQSLCWESKEIKFKNLRKFIQYFNFQKWKTGYITIILKIKCFLLKSAISLYRTNKNTASFGGGLRENHLWEDYGSWFLIKDTVTATYISIISRVDQYSSSYCLMHMLKLKSASSAAANLSNLL